MKYDVLIIGGGPSGTMCGIALQQAGVRTCLLERASYPREKLCGGLLTQKTINLLQSALPRFPLASVVVNKADAVDLYFQKDKALTLRTSSTYYFTNRQTFDHALAQQYREAGGTLIEGARVNSRQIDFSHQTVEVDGRCFEYGTLVAADGCNSVVVRAAGIVRHDYFCLETRCTPSRFDARDFRIYFGYPKDAYAWYFPKNGFYTVGLGGINKDDGLKTAAVQFFGTVAENAERTKGAFIPSGRVMQLDKLPANVLAIGDAGGFIDPITGEGIYYALLTGTQAAASIVEAQEKNSPCAQAIFQKKTKAIRQNIRYAIRWHNFLYRPRVLAWFIKSIEKHQNFARFYLEKVISTYQYNYKNFVWVYFRKYRGKM